MFRGIPQWPCGCGSKGEIEPYFPAHFLFTVVTGEGGPQFQFRILAADFRLEQRFRGGVGCQLGLDFGGCRQGGGKLEALFRAEAELPHCGGMQPHQLDQFHLLFQFRFRHGLEFPDGVIHALGSHLAGGKFHFPRSDELFNHAVFIPDRLQAFPDDRLAALGDGQLAPGLV